MPLPHAAPWIPPAEPSLQRLAFEATDRAGLAELRAWPEVRLAGVAFGALPPFLAWQVSDGAHHLVLLQVREIGALCRKSSLEVLPADWLENLDLEALARPLAIHPDFPGGASIHVVRLLGPGVAHVRTWGAASEEAVCLVLQQLTDWATWILK